MKDLLAAVYKILGYLDKFYNWIKITLLNIQTIYTYIYELFKTYWVLEYQGFDLNTNKNVCSINYVEKILTITAVLNQCLIIQMLFI